MMLEKISGDLSRSIARAFGENKDRSISRIMADNTGKSIDTIHLLIGLTLITFIIISRR